METNLEYREIISFSPVLLQKPDLFELEKLLLDSHSHQNDSLRIKLTHNHKNFAADSIDQLLKLEGLPNSTDKLSIDRSGWIEKDRNNFINRGISITLHHNYVQCQVHSIDEDWFQGKITRLRAFFKDKKPWYALLNRISPAFPTVALLSFLYAITLIKKGNPFLAVAPGLLFLLASVVSVLTFQQKLFPYVKVVLVEKKEFPIGMNEISILLGIITGIITIFQAFVGWFTKK